MIDVRLHTRKNNFPNLGTQTLLDSGQGMIANPNIPIAHKNLADQIVQGLLFLVAIRSLKKAKKYRNNPHKYFQDRNSEGL